MRILTFLKILVFLLIVALMTIFVIQNNAMTIIRFPFLQPIRVGRIYILLGSFGLGVISTLFLVFINNAKRKRKRELLEAEEEESEDLVEDD